MKSERGVRQGYILSPILFSLYTKELAVKLRRMNAGVRIWKDKICFLLYANDVIIMSDSAEGLQSILYVVDEYGKKILELDLAVNKASR